MTAFLTKNINGFTIFHTSAFAPIFTVLLFEFQFFSPIRYLKNEIAQTLSWFLLLSVCKVYV
jgi:hypothetical protein